MKSRLFVLCDQSSVIPPTHFCCVQVGAEECKKPSMSPAIPEPQSHRVAYILSTKTYDTYGTQYCWGFNVITQANQK